MNLTFLGTSLKIISLIDHVQVCEGCRLNHKDHDMKPIKEMKDQAQAQKKKLESLVEDFTNKKEEARDRINDLRRSGVRELERGFEKAIEILKEREKDTIRKFESLLESKNDEIKKVIDEDDRLKDK